MKLYNDASDPLLWSIQIAANYAKRDFEQVVTNADPNSKDLFAISPLGKLPVLQTNEGSIFEANAITRYIARLGKGHLYGANDFESAQVEQFLDVASSEIELPSNVWIYPILGYIPNNAAAVQKAQGGIRKILGFLNKHLQTRTYLVGERITIADIVVSMSLYYLYQKVLDTKFRNPYVNTNRWYLTVVNQPEFKAVIGEVTLCGDKAEVAPEGTAVAASTKKESKPAEKKEQKPKKEEKKPEKKPEPKDEEEEDEYAEKESKKPNALDALPPSKFVLDEWKRVYSNAEDTRKDACPWLWNNLDKEGFSIYFCDYKYNNECEKIFMTCNLLGGWIQRLDKLRKYGFGSLIIFGEEPKLEVAGVWIFRGPEPPQEMKETDDYILYTWRKMNPDDAAEREIVNDFWSWNGNFSGRKFNQGKIFK